MSEYQRKLEYRRAQLAEAARVAGLGWGLRWIEEKPGEPYDENAPDELEWATYAALRRPNQIHTIIVHHPANHPQRP